MGSDEDPDGGHIKDSDIEGIKRMETGESKSLLSDIRHMNRNNADFVKTLEQCQRAMEILNRHDQQEEQLTG